MMIWCTRWYKMMMQPIVSFLLFLMVCLEYFRTDLYWKGPLTTINMVVLGLRWNLVKTLVDVDGSQAWLWTRLETIGFRLVWWFWMFGHIHICRGCCSPNFCTSAAACWSAFSEAAVWKMQRKGFSCNCPGRRVLLLSVFLGIGNP